MPSAETSEYQDLLSRSYLVHGSRKKKPKPVSIRAVKRARTVLRSVNRHWRCWNVFRPCLDHHIKFQDLCENSANIQSDRHLGNCWSIVRLPQPLLYSSPNSLVHGLTYDSGCFKVSWREGLVFVCLGRLSHFSYELSKVGKDGREPFHVPCSLQQSTWSLATQSNLTSYLLRSCCIY